MKRTSGLVILAGAILGVGAVLFPPDADPYVPARAMPSQQTVASPSSSPASSSIDPVASQPLSQIAPQPAPTLHQAPSFENAPTVSTGSRDSAWQVFRCTNATGKPVKGALVRVEVEGRYTLLVTDANGLAQLPLVWLGGEGNLVSGRVSHRLYSRVTTFGPIRLPADRVHLRLTELAPHGTLFLRVLDDRGLPPDRVTLVAKRGRLKLVSVVLEPAQGHSSVALPAGRLVVQVKAAGCVESRSLQVQIPPGGTVDGGELCVARKATLAGAVASPQANQVAHAVVEGPSGAVRHRISPNGRFSVLCEPGPTRLSLEVQTPTGSRSGPPLELDLRAGERVEGLALALGSDRISVQGVVRNEAGEPVPGARVNAPSRSTITDSEGRYALPGLAPGSHPLTVRKNGYTTGRATVETGGELVSYSFQISRAGWVRGRVADDLGKRVFVRLEKPEGAHVLAMVRPDGTYGFKALKAGRYGLSVVSNGERPSSPVEVEVRGGLETVAPLLSIH